jgi:A-macroglobulin TED domain
VVSAAHGLHYLDSVTNLSNQKRNVGKLKIKSAYDEIVSKKNTVQSVRDYNSFPFPEFDDIIQSTAFVAKFLNSAKEFIEIDQKHISDSIGFLVSEQEPTGEFTPDSEKLADIVALTAFVAISIFENEKYSKRFENTTESALSFIDKKFIEVDDDHALAISAYALSFADQQNAHKFLDKLMNQKKTNEDQTYWKNDDDSRAVETAAYAILALSKLGKPFEAIGIMKWLATQQNLQTGGFKSTIDTMLAYQAAAEMAKHFYTNDYDLTLKFKVEDEDQDQIFHITKNNANKVQSLKIQSRGGVSINVEGTGVAFLQVKEISEADSSTKPILPLNRRKKF